MTREGIGISMEHQVQVLNSFSVVELWEEHINVFDRGNSKEIMQLLK